MKAMGKEMGRLLDQVSANRKDDNEMGLTEESTKNMAVRSCAMLPTYVIYTTATAPRRGTSCEKRWSPAPERSPALLTQLSRVMLALQLNLRTQTR